MITISLCMIVKNEENNLENCLNSVKGIVDEIIIADTGSTDKTKEIASKFTDKIFDYEWIDDFSAARNFSFSHASKEYIMWLDADDVILPDDAEKLIKLKSTLSPAVDSVMLKYNIGFDQSGNVTFSYYRERIVKRSINPKWREPVHEYLEKGFNIINEDIAITHTKKQTNDSSRNLRIYENLLEKGETLSSRGMYYYARELKDSGRFHDAIKWFNEFLNYGKGWIEDNISACSDLAKCYQAVKNPKEELLSILKSFTYDVPRGELCCQLAYYFMSKKRYQLAVYWFEAALTAEIPTENWGFRQIDCYGYIPSIELAVCYERLGERKKAIFYNDKAASYKPDSPSVKYNKKYFEQGST